MLNASPSKLSKEPRPVYAAELDVLGFDRYWQYEPQLDAPYLWAEANAYYYRGVLVAKLRGGDVYTAPEIDLMKDEEGTPLLPKSTVLHPVDIGRMVEKNRELLGLVEQTTAKKIVAVYEKYQKKLDCFHVAFSGGKDSCVLLDLVKKALPQGSFVVVFGDTGMEFPDTYTLVDAVEADCKREGIPFYRAKSHFTPQESWKLFGPPSRTLRWCCSVHKSTPQVLKLREITGKTDYRGLAFVGVRAQESTRRSHYGYLSDGTKVRGQLSHNSILEWTSAEIWLYIYAKKVLYNEAYKKGSARVGCICCPMGGGKASYIESKNYPEIVKSFHSLIQKSNERTSVTDFNYLSKGGWNARRNGRFLTGNKSLYTEYRMDEKICLEVYSPRMDWREWIQTLGNLTILDNKYYIQFQENLYEFIVLPRKKGYLVQISERIAKENPLFGKVFRQVFRKSAFCVSCQTCQAACKFGCITFAHGFKIERCRHCLECHTIISGCYVYDSRKIPQGGKDMKSINCFSNHAPKEEWLQDFFRRQNHFLEENSLGPVQKIKFKRFLKDAELIQKERVTNFARLGSIIVWNEESFLGLMLISLVNKNPQIEWYVQNMDIGKIYPRKVLVAKLETVGQSTNNTSSILASYRRIVSTSFGTVLNFGHVTEKGELVRTKCVLSDPRVLLYGLFKFAEKCGDYKGFTLSTLLNDTIDRDGISPTRIFGLTREEAKPMLRGLSARYPEFIDAAFTHDLEKITLSADKSSADVLTLFEGEEA